MDQGEATGTDAAREGNRMIRTRVADALRDVADRSDEFDAALDQNDRDGVEASVESLEAYCRLGTALVDLRDVAQDLATGMGTALARVLEQVRA